MAIDNIVAATNNFSPLLTTGVLVGFLIGYAIKKIMKILAVGAGLFFTALVYLESQNIVNINWDKLQTYKRSRTNSTCFYYYNFALPVTGISTAIGFAIGLMRA